MNRTHISYVILGIAAAAGIIGIYAYSVLITPTSLEAKEYFMEIGVPKGSYAEVTIPYRNNSTDDLLVSKVELLYPAELALIRYNFDIDNRAGMVASAEFIYQGKEDHRTAIGINTPLNFDADKGTSVGITFEKLDTTLKEGDILNAFFRFETQLVDKGEYTIKVVIDNKPLFVKIRVS